MQPMVISYARNKRLDPCWVEPAGLPVHTVALRLLLQFHSYMEARGGSSMLRALLRDRSHALRRLRLRICP